MPGFFQKEAMLLVSMMMAFSSVYAGIRSISPSSENMAPSASKAVPASANDVNSGAGGGEVAEPQEDAPAEVPQILKRGRSSLPEQATRADAFVAAADWEFDGFVSGGQDSSVRSMFYLNDLLYLNIGGQQGILKGDRLEIFKRGDKVRDPQSGRFIGYEVRRAAVVLATDRIEDDACAVRIIRTHEPVEVGDLVRRIQ